jgi:hypothetical protein
MKCLPVTLSLLLLIGCSAFSKTALVSKIPGDRREFEIVQVEYSAREAAATITFASVSGIVAFDLSPDGRKLKKLTLIVNNERFCEGLSFQDRDGHTTDLRHAEGVQVFPRGTNLVIMIASPAIDLLKEGGRGQYINQYR